ITAPLSLISFHISSPYAFYSLYLHDALPIYSHNDYPPQLRQLRTRKIPLQTQDVSKDYTFPQGFREISLACRCRRQHHDPCNIRTYSGRNTCIPSHGKKHCARGDHPEISAVTASVDDSRCRISRGIPLYCSRATDRNCRWCHCYRNHCLQPDADARQASESA